MLGGTNSNSQLIKNLDVTLTENGTFVSGEDYTGFGTVTVAVPPDVMDTELSITPTATDVITIPTWDEYTGPFTDPVTGTEYAGAGNIKVRRISSWIDSNISADNIRKGQTILGVSGNVIELLPQTKTTKSTTTQFTIYPDSGYNALSSVTINPMVLQNVTHVTPKSYSVTVYKGSGYDGMNSVQIDAVTADVDSNIRPENIKKNVTILGVRGTYDNYVPPVTTVLNAIPRTSAQTLTPPSGVDGYNTVNIEAVTAAIDNNIRPENIKRDIEILGVIGTYRIENLQDKTVDPQPYIQTVTFDSTLGYEGLNSVTVNPVTSSVDSNIRASNIKKDVVILGVTGEYDPQPNIQDPVTVNPTTLNQSVTPDIGYDGLSRVDINAVTASIDPNILAENIKKNIVILGVTGTHEGIIPKYQESKTVQPVTSGDIEVTADPTYDALLKVIVKAVTASIDPNIMPRNIRKNVSILGVLGTMEEGGEQKWFDFSGIQNFVELNQDAYSEGGNESIKITASDNNYQLAQTINETFPGIENINAVMFTQVYGYDDEEITDDIVEDCYINFIGGSLYQDFAHLTNIPDQIRYFYPYVNDYNVNGLTFGLERDDGQARVMKLYVITDSYQNHEPTPVLVNGVMDAGYLPEGYDGFRFVKDIQVPAHNVFIPKMENPETIHWVLRDEDTITTRILETANQPDIIQASAYDTQYGVTDTEKDIIIGGELPNSVNLSIDRNTGVASPINTSKSASFTVPGNAFEKQDQSYYYIKFSPARYPGGAYYINLAYCNSLFWIGLYCDGSNYYYPAWVNWTSATEGNWNTSTSSSYRMYTGSTYWFRIYINGTSTTVAWSSNGTSWTNLSTFTNSYVNPITANQIKFISSNIVNNKFYSKDIYVLKDNVKLYSPLENIYGKQTSHEIVPSIRDMLLVNRDQTRTKIGSNGNETFRYSSYNPSNKLLDLNTNGYIQIPNIFNITGKTWEICQHIKLPPVTSSSDRYLACFYANQSNNYWNRLLVNTNGTMYWEGWYSSGSRYVEGTLGGSNLVVGNDYYIRHGWNGSTWYCQVSEYANFSSFIVNWTANTSSSTYTSGSTLVLGNSVNKGSNTSIRYLYLDDSTYVKVNGQIVWTGYDSYPLRGNLVNYVDDGSPTILDAYLVGSNLRGKITNANIVGNVHINNVDFISQLSPGGYIETKDNINLNTADSWEILTKWNIPSLPSNSSDWFCLKSGSIFSFNFYLKSAADGSKGVVELSSDGSSWSSIGTLETLQAIPANTDFYIKIQFTGSEYNLYYGVDENNLVLQQSITSSTKVYSTTNVFGFGVGRLGTAINISELNLDLSESYIKINDEIWWQPEIIDTYDYDWIFTQDENWTYTGLTNLGKKGELVVPEHNIYRWNQSKMKWEGLKQLTFNVTDEDEFYTKVIEN